MGKQVIVIKTTDYALPVSSLYVVGATVILTDHEFEGLSAKYVSECLTSITTVADPDRNPVVSGSGGGGAPLVGASQSYTFIEADLADADSWYGAIPAKVYMTWTPTVTGDLYLLPSVNDRGGNFDVFVWKGTVPNTDYPDTTAASGPYTDPRQLTDISDGQIVSSPIRVEAGQTYTIILVDWSGEVGGVLDLDSLFVSLYAFGGLTGPPPPPPAGFQYLLAELPNGTGAWRPVPLDPDGVKVDRRTNTLDISTPASAVYARINDSGITLWDATTGVPRATMGADADHVNFELKDNAGNSLLFASNSDNLIPKFGVLGSGSAKMAAPTDLDGVIAVLRAFGFIE